jgi:hypothetical protein
MFTSRRTGILRLYRHILKAAAVFPSKKRVGMIKEIKLEFRENAGMTNGVEIRKQLSVARDGLDRMQAFSGASRATAARAFCAVLCFPTPPPGPHTSRCPAGCRLQIFLPLATWIV